MKTKQCTGCKEYKILDDFYLCLSRGKKQPQSKCKLCANENRKRAKRRQFYGLSEDEWELLKMLYPVCTLCGIESPGQARGQDKQWHIDHDHKTGHIRGLLCSRCNIGLGNFKDNPTVLRMAAKYIEESSGVLNGEIVDTAWEENDFPPRKIAQTRNALVEYTQTRKAHDVKEPY